MVKSDDDKLTEIINFRLAHKTYINLMEYLKKTTDSISKFMREATFNYLKMKKEMQDKIEKEGNGKLDEKEVDNNVSNSS